MSAKSVSTSRKGKKRRSRLRRSHSRPGKKLPIPDSSRVETGFPIVVWVAVVGSRPRRKALMFRGSSLGAESVLMADPLQEYQYPRWA